MEQKSFDVEMAKKFMINMEGHLYHKDMVSAHDIFLNYIKEHKKIISVEDVHALLDANEDFLMGSFPLAQTIVKERADLLIEDSSLAISLMKSGQCQMGIRFLQCFKEIPDFLENNKEIAIFAIDNHVSGNDIGSLLVDDLAYVAAVLPDVVLLDKYDKDTTIIGHVISLMHEKGLEKLTAFLPSEFVEISEVKDLIINRSQGLIYEFPVLTKKDGTPLIKEPVCG